MLEWGLLPERDKIERNATLAPRNDNPTRMLRMGKGPESPLPCCVVEATGGREHRIDPPDPGSAGAFPLGTGSADHVRRVDTSFQELRLGGSAHAPPSRARAFRFTFYSVDTWLRIALGMMGSLMPVTIGIL